MFNQIKFSTYIILMQWMDIIKYTDICLSILTFCVDSWNCDTLFLNLWTVATIMYMPSILASLDEKYLAVSSKILLLKQVCQCNHSTLNANGIIILNPYLTFKSQWVSYVPPALTLQKFFILHIMFSTVIAIYCYSSK